MVAGFTCQASDAYNRFVLAYRPELQKSDADLKTYFLRREGARGEAAYDTFKTKLANLSSLSDIANTTGYCANTHAAFALALESRQSLASFVADQRLMIALPEQQLCSADPARPVVAAAAPAPSIRQIRRRGSGRGVGRAPAQSAGRALWRSAAIPGPAASVGNLSATAGLSGPGQ